MKNIIEKIKKLTLEEINKNLIFVAILSLLFRVGNFSTNYLPKPFELIILLIILLTILDFILNKKIKDLFFSIPKNIRIILYILIFSILLGWGVSFISGVSTSFNMLLEFGAFLFSLSVFLLIFFYGREDKDYITKYFYALLIPVVYIFFIIFPSLAYDFNLALGTHFVGFNTNPNIVSKFLIIPVIFFIVRSLYRVSSKFMILVNILVSSLLVSLVFWTASRGAILSVFLGIIFVSIIILSKDFSFKKLIKNILILFFILFIGFIFVPKESKSPIADRFVGTYNNINGIDREIRFKIWDFYIRKALTHPLGFGPNTHMDSNILLSNGQYENSGSHNSYLQIWIWGGVLGLVSFIYLLFIAFRELKNNLSLDFSIINIALIGILFSLSISIFFDDSYTIACLWVILALSLIKHKK